MNNPHEHCGAAWRHLRESLIEILGDRLPPNPRRYSDADIRNAVRALVDDADTMRGMLEIDAGKYATRSEMRALLAERLSG